MAVTTNPALLARLQKLQAGGVMFATVSHDATDHLLRRIQANFSVVPNAENDTIDASDVAPAEIADWLSQRLTLAKKQIVVVWLQYRSAIELSKLDFAGHYEDLWYPAADDIWVVDDSLSWLLEIDHEEFFRYRRHS